jgi:hypothetical protein
MTPRGVSHPLLWILYTWLGAAFLLNVLLCLTDIAKAVFVLAPLAFQGKPLDRGRREFLAKLFGGIAAFSTLGLMGVGFLSATASAIRTQRLRVPLSKWPSTLDGYRIVQITDIHVGPTIGKDFVQTVVDRVNELKPDLIAITGDLADGPVTQLAEQIAPLADLKAKDGVYFVTGNHEYYTGDLDNWLDWLKASGIRPLHNERVTPRKGFDLAGINDFSAPHGLHAPNLSKALSGRDMKRPVILLAHQPKAFPESERMGVDLQLSGHTHGGQIFPFNYVVSLFQPFMAGLYQRGAAQLYVSRGTGYWGPPMRIGEPAEITVIELVRG